MSDRSRIGRSNVRKGKTFERRVAKLLTDWTGVEFRRRRVEGRDATVVERDSTADVIPVGQDTIFSIEAKSGRSFTIAGLLSNPKDTIFTKWLAQATYDAQLLTTIMHRPYNPLLIFKANHNTEWVAFPATVMGRAETALRPIQPSAQSKTPWFPTLYFDAYRWLSPIAHNISHSNNPVIKPIIIPPCYIADWKVFAESVDPASMFRPKPTEPRPSSPEAHSV